MECKTIYGCVFVPLTNDSFNMFHSKLKLKCSFQHFAQAGDYLGGEAYWAGGLHLYTPLPFRPGRGGFGDLFRTHFFLNAGNLCNLNYGKTQQNKNPSSLHIKSKKESSVCVHSEALC